MPPTSSAPPSLLRSSSFGAQAGPAHRPGFVPQPGLFVPTHQHRRGRGAHRVSVLASSSRIVLRVPPVGPGLNKKLFVARPLFLLTPQPPRRRWSIRTLCQSPSPTEGRERWRGVRSGLVVSAGRSIVLASSGGYRCLQGSGSVTRTGRFGWFVTACRCFWTKPPARNGARLPQAVVVRSHAPSRSPGRQRVVWRQEGCGEVGCGVMVPFVQR